MVGLAAGPGRADMVGRKAPEIDAQYWLNSPPLSLAALRGKIVIVEFWATSCPPCRTTIPHLVEMHEKFRGKGVVIISLTQEPRSKVESFARQMGMTYAVGGGSRSGDPYGVRGIPHAFIVDPSGTIAWEGHPMGGLDAAIERQIKKTPPTLMSPKQKAAAMALFDRVEKALKGEQYVTAAALLAKVPAPEADPDVKGRAEAVKAALIEAAGKQMAEAEALLEEKKYYEASVRLEEVIAMAPGSEPAAKAQGQFKALRADGKKWAAVEKGRREHEAAKALAVYEKGEKKKALAERLAALDALAKKFPDTEAGRTAARRAAAMRADPEVMRQIRLEAAERDCKSWLSMAQNYIQADMSEKAKPYLKKVLQQYPDTPHAEEAKKLLAEISGR